MKYRMLDGGTIDLSRLPKKDMAFLLDLQQRANADEDYFELERRVCGKKAYPLKGSLRVTREVHASLLFRVAEDVVDRVGLRQGVIAPDEGADRSLTAEIVSVSQAAKSLGITRAAVIKAANAGRLQGKKVGNAWAILRKSVDGYEVAQHRVEAGRAARAARGSKRRLARRTGA